MRKDIKVNCKGEWQVIPDVDEWKYKFDDLLCWVYTNFYDGAMSTGVSLPILKFSYHNGYIMKDITGNSDLKLSLISTANELEIWVDEVDNGVSVVDEMDVTGSGIDETFYSSGESEGEVEMVSNFEENVTENSEENSDDVTVTENYDGNDKSEEDLEFTSDADESMDYELHEQSSTSEGEGFVDEKGSDDDGDGLSDIDGNEEGLALDSDNDEMNREVLEMKKCVAGFPFKYEANGKIKLCKGMLFDDVYHFRRILKDFLIQEGFDVNKIKNEKTRVTVACKGDGCSWRLHASPCPDGITYKIKTFVDCHCCVMQSRFKEVTENWIAEKLMSQFKVDPNKTVASIAGDLLNFHKIQGLNKTKLVRARNKARMHLQGDHTKLYGKLPGYAEVILTYNPGSIVKLAFHERVNMSDPPIFKMMFVMLGAVKNGFLRGCRPYIGVDGCFLKGPYCGCLLVATAVDGNNGIVPLAFCVVETECKESWVYFMNALKTTIGEDNNGICWTFMSDRQKGLIDSIGRVFPLSSQRYCCRHIAANLCVKFKGDLRKKYFWRAANAFTKRDFDKHMLELKIESAECHSWLSAIPAILWSRHAFERRCKVDHITNNISESLNSWLNNYRHLPVLSLFEEIRLKSMRRFHDRYQKACTWEGVLCPKVRDILNKNVQEGRSISVIQAGQKKFQVICEDIQHIVDLEARLCSCEEWDITGIPCKHGVACITSIREQISEYVHEAYHIQNYLQVYKDIINPQPDVGNILVPSIDAVKPPPTRRRPGRPKKSRIREVGEEAARKRSSTLKCSKCKGMGHNQRTCKEPSTSQFTSNSTLFEEINLSGPTMTSQNDIPRQTATPRIKKVVRRVAKNKTHATRNRH